MSTETNSSISGSSTRVPFFRRQKPQNSIRQRQVEKEDLNKIDEDDSNKEESDNSASGESTGAEKIRLKISEKRKMRNNRMQTVCFFLIFFCIWLYLYPGHKREIPKTQNMNLTVEKSLNYQINAELNGITLL